MPVWYLTGEEAVPENQTGTFDERTGSEFQDCIGLQLQPFPDPRLCPNITMRNIIWGILHTLLFLLPSGLSRSSLPIWYLYTEFHPQKCLLVVKLWPRINIQPKFAHVDALYHYWKISVVSLIMALYWSVTRNRIRAISCDWEQRIELVLHLLEAPEHLGER